MNTSRNYHWQESVGNGTFQLYEDGKEWYPPLLHFDPPNMGRIERSGHVSGRDGSTNISHPSQIHGAIRGLLREVAIPDEDIKMILACLPERIHLLIDRFKSCQYNEAPLS